MNIQYLLLAKTGLFIAIGVGVVAVVFLIIVAVGSAKEESGGYNTVLTRDSYRIKHLADINAKYKFEKIDKEYHYDFEVSSKEELASFDYSEKLYQLIKEKPFLFKDTCKKAEQNAKLYEAYMEEVNNIYFNKKILIGEATSKSIPLRTYKKMEKAHYNELLYKPVTEVIFYIHVKVNDSKGKKQSTAYTGEDVKELFARVDREERKRPRP